MAIYFTADTHFGHENIIRYCKRPFHSAAEMNEAIFSAWAGMVCPEDTIYHLGDVAFGSREAVKKIIERVRHLPGHKYLVPGNHDHRHMDLISTAFEEVLPDLTQVSLTPRNQGASVSVVLCHYPMMTWNHAFQGSIQLYGHVHNRIRPSRQQCDVGVDAWGYAPVRFEHVLSRLQQAPVHTHPDMPDSED